MAGNSILGIDLRVRSVKVIEITKLGAEFSLTAWGMSEIPLDILEKHPEKELAQSHLLASILKEKQIKSKKCAVVAGGQDVYITQLEIPHLSKSETREAVKWKLQDELPFTLAEAVVDYFKVKDSRVIAVAVKRSLIDQLAGITARAGLKITSIIPVPLALKQAFLPELIGDEVVCPIYLGRMTTNISFYQGPELKLSREVPMGGEDITKAMTSVLVSEEGRLELKYDQAEKIKLEYGVPVDLENYPKIEEIPLAHLQAVVRPALEKISSEIIRTIEYFKSRFGDLPIKKIILQGGSAHTPHFPEFLSQTIGIPVEVTDPLEVAKPSYKLGDQDKFKKHSTQLTGAIGAALGYFTGELNLLPEEIRDPKKAFIKKHSTPREAGLILAALLIMIYGLLYFYSSQLNQRIIKVQAQVNVLKPKIARLEEIERAVKEQEGRAGIFKRIELERLKIPLIFEELSRSLPDQVLVQQLNLSESGRTLSIAGAAFGVGDTPENNLSHFVYALSQAPSFEKVDLLQASKNESYSRTAFSFQISAKLRKL